MLWIGIILIIIGIIVLFIGFIIEHPGIAYIGTLVCILGLFIVFEKDDTKEPKEKVIIEVSKVQVDTTYTIVKNKIDTTYIVTYIP